VQNLKYYLKLNTENLAMLRVLTKLSCIYSLFGKALTKVVRS